MAEFCNVTKKFGEHTVIRDFSLSLPADSKTVIMGESGSGKTTLLRIAAGLVKPDSGEFRHEGDVAVMFQEPRLLPWKNALENIRIVLPKERIESAERYLDAVGLSSAADKLPAELSGGMAQRVAFARFLAYAEVSGAELLLLDEPFSALDDETAAKMIELLKRFSHGKTLLMVSHDESDAQRLEGNIIKL